MAPPTGRSELETALEELADGPGRLCPRRARRLAQQTGLPLADVERAALEKGVVPERYDRNLGTLGADGQRRLLEARVAVVGLGGLGEQVVECLARLGVGRIVGFDPDCFASTDLNRQIHATGHNLGEPKGDQVRRRVERINPAVSFRPREETFQNAGPEAFAGCELVFDCLDSIPARLELAESCSERDLVLVHGAVAGWSGQAGVCRPGGSMLRTIYGGGKRGLEGRLGNLPFTVAVTANLMVSKAVPLLLGEPSPENERLQIFDLRAGEWETVEF
ncbi:MAG: HesA/MoeB/ThiF family protein [Planctomycetota bacterium]